MDEEMDALISRRIWDLVSPPKRVVVVDCYWVYTLKYLTYSSVNRYKARIFAKGYTQMYGVDYFETSPVARLTPFGFCCTWLLIWSSPYSN